jgi:excisionase family DNA binding protein
VTTHLPRRLYNEAEVCEMVGGLGHTKFCELLRDGELERVKLGRKTRVSAESVDAYVARLVTAARGVAS